MRNKVVSQRQIWRRSIVKRDSFDRNGFIRADSRASAAARATVGVDHSEILNRNNAARTFVSASAASNTKFFINDSSHFSLLL